MSDPISFSDVFPNRLIQTTVNPFITYSTDTGNLFNRLPTDTGNLFNGLATNLDALPNPNDLYYYSTTYGNDYLYIFHPDVSANSSHSFKVNVTHPRCQLYYYLVGGGGSSISSYGGNGGQLISGNLTLSKSDSIDIRIGPSDVSTNLVTNGFFDTITKATYTVIDNYTALPGSGSYTQSNSKSFTDYGFSINKNVYFYGGSGGNATSLDDNTHNTGNGGRGSSAVTDLCGGGYFGGSDGYFGGSDVSLNIPATNGGVGSGGGGGSKGNPNAIQQPQTGYSNSYSYTDNLDGGNGGAGGGGGSGGFRKLDTYITPVITSVSGNTTTTRLDTNYYGNYGKGGIGGVGGGGGGAGGGSGLGGVGVGGVGLVVLYFVLTEPPVPCFKEDTKILTIDGYVPIQNLRKGDLIKTLKNDYVPIKLIGKDIITNKNSESIIDRLFVCTNEKYPEIFEDLYLTGLHSVLVDELTKEEREITMELFGLTDDIYVTDDKYRLPVCHDNRAKIFEEEGEFTIYHIALEHENEYINYGIYANGLLVETTSISLLKESKMTFIE
jgi:hypothetical protein